MMQFDWLLPAFSDAVFTAFDTETTGLDAKLNRVVEIGGIRFDKSGISARFNVLVNPGLPMPAEVSKINGITDTMLAGQPVALQVLPDFIRFAGDSILVAHNAPFDISFINEELARNSLPQLKNRVVDTRILAKEVFPGLPKYSLQELAVRFGIEALDAHRAEDDARVCMELFLVCLEKIKKEAPAEVIGVQGKTVQTPAEKPGKINPEEKNGKDIDDKSSSSPDFQEDMFADDFESEEDSWEEN
jgi:DNA polymerase-3 subunit epsilon